MKRARIPDPAHPDADVAEQNKNTPKPFSPVNTKTTKGMLLYTAIPGIPRRFKFQYNPQSLKIGLKSQLYGGQGGKQPVTGAPSLSMSVTIVLEATRMSATERGILGIRPQISALETLLYPSLANVALNTGLMALGKVEAVPAGPPLCLFFYGLRPPIPVKLTGMDVEEKLHDNKLNPMHAEVTLQMEGFTYSEVPIDNPNFALSVTHQTLHQGLTALHYLPKVVMPPMLK